MRVFFTACIAAVAIAVIAAVVLDQVQESAGVAFSTSSVRI